MPATPIAIVGPTASGKTALSIEVARRVDGEVISMDSRQVYRGMDIGTAKATAVERGEVRHHLLDVADPGSKFSAGKFSRAARSLIPEIQARGHRPILAGGTGFYLRSLTHPIFAEPSLDPARRARLLGWLETLDTEVLNRWLTRLDPESGERFQDWGGRQRVIRALEMPLLTGQTLPWWHRNAPPAEPALRIPVVVLELDRNELYRRIDERVSRMIEAGLAEEVRGLLQNGLEEGTPGTRTPGYAEMIPFLRGEASLETTMEEIRANTRAYARRQLTWFRTKLPAETLAVDAGLPLAEQTELTLRWLDGIDSPASTLSRPRQ